MIRYTLSELCAIIGEALDDSLAPSYWVKAEISSLSEKGGHLYLELVESSGSTPQKAMRVAANDTTRLPPRGFASEHCMRQVF